MNHKFEKYNDVQTWFARNLDIQGKSRSHALNIICSKIAETTGFQRVGVWLFSFDNSSLVEELTVLDKGIKTHLQVLLKSDYPKYFSLIEKERVISVDDTLDCSETDEFRKDFFKSHHIRALVDSPIYSDGQIVGVLRCEQVDAKKKWEVEDKFFVSTCADFLGRFFETEKRYNYENNLRHRINYLENDLKKKLDDLNQAKLSLDLAIEAAGAGKWDWNLETNTASLNATWFTSLGYEPNELEQNFDTFVSVLYPEDKDKVFDELDKHINGKTPIYECRYRMITKSGEIKWHLDRGRIIKRDPSGKPLFMSGIGVDITPIVQWEKSQRLAEQQLKYMIESLPTPVAMLDKELKYITFSSTWIKEWGEIFKTKIGETFYETFYKNWLEKMRLALEGKVFRKEEELIEMSPGENLWIRWVIQPWKNNLDEVGGVVLFAENISSRKDAESHLAQASKLSALGEMAGGIAHEINNPLSIIKGYVELVKRLSTRGLLGPDSLNQYLTKIDQTIQRISKIVSGMKRFARESSHDEKINYSLKNIIEETLDICQERINNSGTSIELEFTNTDPLVFCRPVEISQVLLNLVNNSFYATSKFPHPWIKIKVEDSGKKYRMLIIDNGEGIPADVQQKLFQPFFTTKDIGVGTGLGLSISRGIIEEHGGQMYYLEKAPNTTFVIELPKSHLEQQQSLH
jgi:PAS domain S-box-containing protein